MHNTANRKTLRRVAIPAVVRFALPLRFRRDETAREKPHSNG